MLKVDASALSKTCTSRGLARQNFWAEADEIKTIEAKINLRAGEFSYAEIAEKIRDNLSGGLEMVSFELDANERYEEEKRLDKSSLTTATPFPKKGFKF